MLFGYLADRFGRTRLYGIELVLVIVSTIGVATSSHGYGDISFLGLFIWWRFVMGIGMLRPLLGPFYRYMYVTNTNQPSCQALEPNIR